MNWRNFQSEIPTIKPGDQILLRSVSGEFFVGEVTSEGILKRSGTGYRYSLRDSTLSHWCEIVDPGLSGFSQNLN
ncbi:hypothetical protein JWG45_17580 [Leptospira sp. 201903070]|uniref:Uncharacterized protein n=1 Tax=Leptospira ainlahdjerensis TaxID=2810033 RepID=A0ABS2UIU8_9LEPT|nr:hypothetical protein [Leptospira ainlahdjerensis]MBM9578960.1 hypothetical protein [Leptospira ainlahdjerensis]